MKQLARMFTLAIVCAVVGHFSSRTGHTQGSSCFVTTASGNVQGVDAGSSCAFLGLPFASPPIGNLRWKPPQAAAPWAPATLDATTLPAGCGSPNTEDCLKLNIWMPRLSAAAPAPVLVWFHSGAFVAAGGQAASNGQQMAERTGAIVIAPNYRVGPFGFLAHRALTAEDPMYSSSGNYGLLDQRAALVWVRDHIAAFGGDPHNVTIAGQSAGAHSVSLHVVSPGSAGLFGRAIMQSGSASSHWRTLADAESLGDKLAAALGCTDPAQVLACMRAKSSRDVLLALPSGQQQLAESARTPWSPVVDGLEVPDQPRTLYEGGTFNHVPVIIGTTRDEGWIYVDRSFPAGLTAEQYQTAVETEFGVGESPAILALYPIADFLSPKHALARLAGDAEYVCEARRVARLISRTGTPVYQYSFEREVDVVAPGLVIHANDTNFVFGNNFGPPSNYVLNDGDRALSSAMSDYWARFAASGNPNRSRRDRRQQNADRYYRHENDDGDEDNDNSDVDHDDSSVRWPAFKHRSGRGRGADKYLVLDVPIREARRLREAQCDFWEPYFLGSVVGSSPASSTANDFCGATIGGNLKLDHDLTCAGNGLTVGADRITLDLNGHSITGPGGGVGISVTGRTRVSILGGTVKNFEAGVRTIDSTGVVIKGNGFLANTDGVDLQIGSSENTVMENAFRDSRSRGIMLRTGSIANTIKDNTFSSNRVGVLLFGSVDTTVKDNLVSASVLAGIRLNVIATGNSIERNTVVSNPAGIDFIVTPTGSAIGNTLKRNTIALNTCGVKGPVANNTLIKNIFKGNGTDSCP